MTSTSNICRLKLFKQTYMKKKFVILTKRILIFYITILFSRLISLFNLLHLNKFELYIIDNN